eukprot:m.643662 g.643662  ORF g.643662 m.643662 type:complete len:385 (+) comp22643_c0_seq23:150-1304(+)
MQPFQFAIAARAAIFHLPKRAGFRHVHRSASCSAEILPHEMPNNAEPPVQPENPKVLKVAVVGLPNVGKSTLVNQLVGHKVSIVSPRVQTTRERVLGIATEGTTQVLYMDTPGVIPYREGHRLRIARPLLTEANHALSEADVVLNMVDGRVSDAKGATTDTAWVDMLPTVATPEHCKHVLVVNKMDVLRKFPLILREIYLEAAAIEGKTASQRNNNSENVYGYDDDGSAVTPAAGKPFRFSSTYEISALTGDGIASLKEYILRQARDGEWLYRAGVHTDQSLLKVVEECIREQLFEQLYHELPYALFQRNVGWEETPDGVLHVEQAVITKTASTRRIIVGKGGAMIRKISEAAEREISTVLQRPVHLVVSVAIASSRERWERGL